ncbi:hypothetical protein EsH8_III_000984 [Colletotrichum jinshuiense]
MQPIFKMRAITFLAGLLLAAASPSLVSAEPRLILPSPAAQPTESSGLKASGWYSAATRPTGRPKEPRGNDSPGNPRPIYASGPGLDANHAAPAHKYPSPLPAQPREALADDLKEPQLLPSFREPAADEDLVGCKCPCGVATCSYKVPKDTLRSAQPDQDGRIFCGLRFCLRGGPGPNGADDGLQPPRGPAPAPASARRDWSLEDQGGAARVDIVKQAAASTAAATHRKTRTLHPLIPTDYLTRRPCAKTRKCGCLPRTTSAAASPSTRDAGTTTITLTVTATPAASSTSPPASSSPSSATVPPSPTSAGGAVTVTVTVTATVTATAAPEPSPTYRLHPVPKPPFVPPYVSNPRPRNSRIPSGFRTRVRPANPRATGEVTGGGPARLVE